MNPAHGLVCHRPGFSVARISDWIHDSDSLSGLTMFFARSGAEHDSFRHSGRTQTVLQPGFQFFVRSGADQTKIVIVTGPLELYVAAVVARESSISSSHTSNNARVVRETHSRSYDSPQSAWAVKGRPVGSSCGNGRLRKPVTEDLGNANGEFDGVRWSYPPEPSVEGCSHAQTSEPQPPTARCAALAFVFNPFSLFPPPPLFVSSQGYQRRTAAQCSPHCQLDAYPTPREREDVAPALWAALCAAEAACDVGKPKADCVERTRALVAAKEEEVGGAVEIRFDYIKMNDLVIPLYQWLDQGPLPDPQRHVLLRPLRRVRLAPAHRVRLNWKSGIITPTRTGPRHIFDSCGRLVDASLPPGLVIFRRDRAHADDQGRRGGPEAAHELARQQPDRVCRRTRDKESRAGPAEARWRKLQEARSGLPTPGEDGVDKYRVPALGIAQHGCAQEISRALSRQCSELLWSARRAGGCVSRAPAGCRLSYGGYRNGTCLPVIGLLWSLRSTPVTGRFFLMLVLPRVRLYSPPGAHRDQPPGIDCLYPCPTSSEPPTSNTHCCGRYQSLDSGNGMFQTPERILADVWRRRSEAGMTRASTPGQDASCGSTGGRYDVPPPAYLIAVDDESPRDPAMFSPIGFSRHVYPSQRRDFDDPRVSWSSRARARAPRPRAASAPGTDSILRARRAPRAGSQADSRESGSLFRAPACPDAVPGGAQRCGHWSRPGAAARLGPAPQCGRRGGVGSSARHMRIGVRMARGRPGPAAESERGYAPSLGIRGVARPGMVERLRHG
ncbi:uncharacterized protein BXZ73DRAFT_77940 [Epithele typhae]|uniref:uncharacterized protein n=1 Tax=Epithele typhae TaxID=378194 RepID=UPI00200882EB|nr:uncharacterized protein BXZ73DRAFT_77940 [Epithele typhae]KAH9930505.1 hypothetical protein BXZ73DRAFT_77940 [Epithele typhae]